MQNQASNNLSKIVCFHLLTKFHEYKALRVKNWPNMRLKHTGYND